MNLLSILSLVFICSINIPRSNSTVCSNNDKKEDNFYDVPNKVFSDISISTSEDLIYNMTQLDITFIPQSAFNNSTGTIVLSSSEETCSHLSEHTFDFKEGFKSVPELGYTGEKLKPGCNYTIIFSVEEFCIIKYYTIPEQKPCQNFLPEDIFDSFPNKVIDNLQLNSFWKNAIRLNISFSPNPEFINHSGYIVINSKMGTCNHPEEYSFSLDETTVIVPRVEFPHSFIDTGCEYMIDFEIGHYCVTTTYTVPDFCAGKEPRAEILEVVDQGSGIFKVLWDPKSSERDKTIIDISYRLDNVPYDVFNSQMIIENKYQLNYSLLNFTRLPKGTNFRLEAIFMNEDHCSNISSANFRVPADYKLIVKLLSLTAILFASISIICILIPTMRAKLMITFKLAFGFASQGPVSEVSDAKYLGIRKREVINLDYVPLEMESCDKFEFPRCRLEIKPDKDPLRGNFGIVYLGRALRINENKGFTMVAVKTLKDNAPSEELETFMEEINTMKKIMSHGSHENVVNMLGCCTIQKPYLMILEFVAYGDLKNYLIDLRNEWSNRKNCSRFIFPDSDSNGTYITPTNTRTISETSNYSVPSPTETDSTILSDDTDESLLSAFTPTPKRKITPALSNIELQSFALQIAKGMAFLESISVVHRDLAARNVLINEMKILKISDFGMSRIGDYVHRNTEQQPLRWMAPESIEQFVCTSKADVWSFGVVLWEIGTLGAFPYDSIPNDCILEYLLYSLKNGIRLMRPEICTDELYSLMLKCWSVTPDERPSFLQIVEHLSGQKKKIYLDFQKLNPAYVFPPSKYS